MNPWEWKHSEYTPTCADEAGAAAVDQVVVIGQDERAALLDLQAVLVTRYLLLTGLLGGGEILSTQPGLVGHLRKIRGEDEMNGYGFMIRGLLLGDGYSLDTIVIVNLYF